MADIIADNQDQTQSDNQDQQTQDTQQTQTQKQDTFTWKSKIGEDLSKSPTLSKFEDTPEGLKTAMESHLNLEKLLGHEKVPLPKGPDDAEGKARFNKAIGVPTDAAGYNLPDAVVPEGATLTFDKAAFSKIAHDNSLTPVQAGALWKTYTEMSVNAYNKYVKTFTDQLNANINTLKAEWGDAYAANIELGDMVIAKFADDKDMGDFLTAALSKDPKGMKFLAKLGAQFAENKVGGFQYKKFSVSPDEAAAEVLKIKSDPNHPYMNDKATEAEHNAAVDYVNRLLAIASKKQAPGQTLISP